MIVTPDIAFRSKQHPSRAELAGLDWEYWAAGRGSAGLLVLGGELSFGDCNRRLMTLFESNFRVLSPSWPAARSVDAVLAGLLALIEHEHLEKVAVFGHAFGAGIAHALARRIPERIETLVLSGLGLCSGLHQLELRAQAAAFKVLPWGSLRQHYEKIFDRLAADAGQRGDELLAVADRLMSRHTHQSALERHALMAELFGHPERFCLHQRLEAPSQVMLLFANDDHVFSRDEQAALVRAYAAPTVTRYLNGGHWVGLLPAQEFERKLELHFARFGGPQQGPRPRRQLVQPTPPSPQQGPRAEVLDWRQGRRLG